MVWQKSRGRTGRGFHLPANLRSDTNWPAGRTFAVVIAAPASRPIQGSAGLFWIGVRGALLHACESKIDFRSASGDHVGKRATGAAGNGPAKCAVSRVEVQITVACLSDVRHVGRGHGAQARPVDDAVVIAGSGEQRLHAPRDRLAPDRIERP